MRMKERATAGGSAANGALAHAPIPPWHVAAMIEPLGGARRMPGLARNGGAAAAELRELCSARKTLAAARLAHSKATPGSKRAADFAVWVDKASARLARLTKRRSYTLSALEQGRTAAECTGARPRSG
jgi:hypothetical protein